MILFQRDWQRFPSAIIDYQTSNQSFLRLAALYRSMGVKNAAFHLSLLQPQLQGVDPHSKTLTDEQKVMVALECRYNPWYYFREVVRVPIQGGDPIQFIANRANISAIWSFFNSIDVALIQPRQTGKSVSIDALMVLLIFIVLRKSNIMMLTKDNGLRRENIERLKNIRDSLPSYLVNRSREDSDNQIELTCVAYGNKYMTGVSQGSERAANNLGRGFTAPIIHIDEGPFIDFIDITLPAALAATTAARDQAMKNGTPHGNIFTTTAGKKDDRSGAFMYKFIHDGAPWNEAFLDAADRDELVHLIRTNSTGRKVLINGTFSHRQLGKTDEWLYNTIVETGADGEAADRDFFNVWTSGTRSSPLSTELNNAILNSEMDPLYNEIHRDGYIIRWYIPENQIAHRMRTGKFVLGLDTSEAVGRDSIGMVLCDVEDMGVVAAATLNETNLIRFAHFLADFLIRYPNVTLVPERKSTGQMIVDLLLVVLPKHGVDPFRRIYNSIVDDQQERKDDFRAISGDLNRRSDDVYDKYKKFFGFNTTSSSRNLLYSTVLQNAAKKAGTKVRDRVLSRELRQLVVRKGRIDHEASGNDDMVIAWLLCDWFLTHTKNLSHYGIDSSRVLSGIMEEGTEKLSPLEQYERQQQQKIKEEIARVYEELKQATDSIEILKLEHRLRALSNKLVDIDDNAATIDAIIQSARESRAKNMQRVSRSKSQLDARAIWGW